MKSLKFNRAHFPRGTLAEVSIVSGMSKIVEVDHVYSPYPNTWLISTLSKTERMLGNDSYNINLVQRIIRRGTLPEVQPVSFTYTELFGHIKCHSCRKSKSAYCVSIHDLVAFMLGWDTRYKMQSYDHVFDYNRIVLEMAKLFNVSPYEQAFINKKKFHRRFKRVISVMKVRTFQDE